MERLSPGGQDGEETDLGAEMLRVGGHFEQRGGAGFEQQGEQPSLILPHERHERVRHAEDQMEVALRQEFRLALREPVLASVGLALGAVPVAARNGELTITCTGLNRFAVRIRSTFSS